MKNTRNTKQKQVILEYLANNSNKHLTIEEIQKDIKEEIGSATIYRMINRLIQEGEVLKIPLNKQGFCYQYNKDATKCNNHYHLVCEECGKIVHFKSEKILEAKVEALKNENFEIDLDKILLYGKCENCGGKKNEV